MHNTTQQLRAPSLFLGPLSHHYNLDVLCLATSAWQECLTQSSIYLDSHDRTIDKYIDNTNFGYAGKTLSMEIFKLMVTP